MTTLDRPGEATWWRGAVVYQVYLRSFADGNGDGLGDLAGLRARLPYLAALGVDAVWINPWYPSPMVDAGYDVSDYRSVDPRFGTLAEAEALLAEAHAAGLRVLLDIVPNHDTARHLSRYAREPGGERGVNLRHLLGRSADLARGARRARAAALLMLALPGGADLYQGEELGLPEVEDLPAEVLDDPVWERSGRTDPGRDGCRVPIPWAPGGPPYGFSPPGAAAPPWLPQPPAWETLAVAVQDGDPASMLELYRAALRLRRDHPALGDGTLRWLATPDGVLAFARDPGFACVVNLSGPGGRPAPLPAGTDVLLASGPWPGTARSRRTPPSGCAARPADSARSRSNPPRESIACFFGLDEPPAGP